MQSFKMMSAVAIMTSLAACGGSTTSVDMTPQVPTTFAQIQSRGIGLADTYGATIDRGDYTDLAALPTTGSARFAGAGAYVVGPGPVMLGQDIIDNADVISRVDMLVRLNDGQVTGTASAFHETDTQTAIQGTLALTGTLDRTADLNLDYGITGSVRGTLQSADLGAVNIDTTLYAVMIGANGAVVAGYMDGTATSAQGSDAVQGAFIAERQ